MVYSDEEEDDMYSEDEQEEQPQPVQPAPVFSLPQQIQPEEPEQRPKPRTNDDTALSEEDIEDIFETGERSDGSVDELERDDVSDIIDVDVDDVTGYKTPKKQRFSRTSKRFRPRNSPPPTMGGMQY